MAHAMMFNPDKLMDEMEPAPQQNQEPVAQSEPQRPKQELPETQEDNESPATGASAANSAVKAEKPAASKGRQKQKTEAVSGKGKEKTSEVDAMVCARVSRSRHKALKVFCATNEMSLSAYLNQMILDGMDHRYTCPTADCGISISVHFTEEQSPSKAPVCPYCGAKMRPVK